MNSINEDNITFIVTIIAIVVITLASIISSTGSKNKPCEYYGDSSVKNVPARCISYFEK